MNSAIDWVIKRFNLDIKEVVTGLTVGVLILGLIVYLQSRANKELSVDNDNLRASLTASNSTVSTVAELGLQALKNAYMPSTPSPTAIITTTLLSPSATTEPIARSNSFQLLPLNNGEAENVILIDRQGLVGNEFAPAGHWVLEAIISPNGAAYEIPWTGDAITITSIVTGTVPVIKLDAVPGDSVELLAAPDTTSGKFFIEYKTCPPTSGAECSSIKKIMEIDEERWKELNNN